MDYRCIANAICHHNDDDDNKQPGQDKSIPSFSGFPRFTGKIKKQNQRGGKVIKKRNLHYLLQHQQQQQHSQELLCSLFVLGYVYFESLLMMGIDKLGLLEVLGIER